MQTETAPRPTAADIAAMAADFGASILRGHQQHGIAAIVQRDHDLLLVSPTGSGKSAVFWTAGALLGGVTLIVSPLKSLMADQRRRLDGLGVECFVWNGDTPEDEKHAFLNRVTTGKFRGYLYTTPESLRNPKITSNLRDNVGLAVVDEAHCCLSDVSYRHSFAHLGESLDAVNPVRRMACTATLVPADRDQLINVLRMRHVERIVSRVSRDEFVFKKIARSIGDLYDTIDRHPNQSGIVFVATRQSAMSIHAAMNSQGRSVTLYHGGMQPMERQTAQQSFMDNTSRVAIATDSFILGLDKPDIRYVIHYDIAASIENWMQGVGRAGRDGQSAFIYPAFIDAGEGIRTRQFLINQSNPDIDDIRKVWDFLCTSPWHRLSQRQIGVRVFGHSGRWLGSSIITKLRRFGLCDNAPDPTNPCRNVYFAKGEFDAANWGQYQAERDGTLRRFKDMVAITQSPDGEIASAVNAYFENESGGDDAPF